MATRCTHLRTDGARCTMIAVNGNELCFYHESRLMRMRARPCPPSTFATVPLVSFIYPEDHGAILENVHAIARALARGDIDARIASVMDRLMNTALRTLRQGRNLEKTLTSDEMIRAFRVDDDGNFRVLDNSPEPSPEADEVPPQPAAISAISAEAATPATHPVSAVIKTKDLNRPIAAIGFKTRRNSTKLRAMALLFRPGHCPPAGFRLDLAE